MILSSPLVLLPDLEVVSANPRRADLASCPTVFIPKGSKLKEPKEGLRLCLFRSSVFISGHFLSFLFGVPAHGTGDRDNVISTDD